jgi:hypothetical protein
VTDDVSARFWNDIVMRLFEGPFHIRLFLQPAMAAIAEYRDGVNDARHGEPLPNPISDNEVRITDISVRSALMRVR